MTASQKQAKTIEFMALKFYMQDQSVKILPLGEVCTLKRS